MDKLPVELLEKIVEELDIVSFVRLTQVSKSYRRAVNGIANRMYKIYLQRILKGCDVTKHEKVNPPQPRKRRRVNLDTDSDKEEAPKIVKTKKQLRKEGAQARANEREEQKIKKKEEEEARIRRWKESQENQRPERKRATVQRFIEEEERPSPRARKKKVVIPEPPAVKPEPAPVHYLKSLKIIASKMCIRCLTIMAMPGDTQHMECNVCHKYPWDIRLPKNVAQSTFGLYDHHLVGVPSISKRNPWYPTAPNMHLYLLSDLLAAVHNNKKGGFVGLLKQRAKLAETKAKTAARKLEEERIQTELRRKREEDIKQHLEPLGLKPNYTEFYWLFVLGKNTNSGEEAMIQIVKEAEMQAVEERAQAERKKHLTEALTEKGLEELITNYICSGYISGKSSKTLQEVVDSMMEEKAKRERLQALFEGFKGRGLMPSIFLRNAQTIDFISGKGTMELSELLDFLSNLPSDQPQPQQTPSPPEEVNEDDDDEDEENNVNYGGDGDQEQDDDEDLESDDDDDDDTPHDFDL